MAIGIIVAFVAAGAIGLSGAGDGQGSDPVTTTTVELSTDAKELLRLLDRRDEAVYHARYEAAAASAEGLVIETWQAPPRVRQDSVVSAEGQSVHTIVLALPAERVRCANLNGGGWTCRPHGSSDADADPLASFRRRLRAGTVAARDEQIDGRSVRCFTLTTAEGASELCVLPSTGIPVRVSGGTTQLRLVTLDDKVTVDVFTPPAPVTAG